jgi:EPS-associated MarR family transcriptional regulator
MLAESDVGPSHFALLRLLSERPHASQRELSRDLGFSLGKTHYLLRALAGKGWVKVQNFARSENKSSYGYLLTPSGLRQKLDMTCEFLQLKELEFAALQQEISILRAELQGLTDETVADGATERS